tara:strand:+ start:2975 stop:3271 length:297 start_codon:yes stop_codon:yes gene_type:complete
MTQHSKVVRVKVIVDDRGITRPDIAIVSGFDYNYPDLKKGDKEVNVTITASDDPALVNKTVAAADFDTEVAKVKGKPSFVEDRPDVEAKKAKYLGKGS